MPSKSASEHLLTAALRYAAQEFRVLPIHTRERNGICSCGKPKCQNIGKHPRTKNGWKDASADPKVIKDWWRRWPRANVGIVTGATTGIVVLDVDPRHGGEKSLEELLRTYGPIPTTWMCHTGGGGRHFYFKHPGGTFRNKPSLLPGIDLRGDGGYIVAPPSLHATGQTYEWGLSSRIGGVELADMPGWLRKKLTAPRPPAVRSQGASGPILEGSRNDSLCSLAGAMRRKGMEEQAIVAALLAENACRCQPPLPNEEVLNIAKSVMRYPPAVDNVKPSAPLTTAQPSDWHLTDLGNTKRLVARHGKDLRYCYPWDRWLAWNGADTAFQWARVREIELRRCRLQERVFARVSSIGRLSVIA